MVYSGKDLGGWFSTALGCGVVVGIWRDIGEELELETF